MVVALCLVLGLGLTHDPSSQSPPHSSHNGHAIVLAAFDPPSHSLWRCATRIHHVGNSYAASVTWWGTTFTAASLVDPTGAYSLTTASLSVGSFDYYRGTIPVVPGASYMLGAVCLAHFPDSPRVVGYLSTSGEGVACCAGFQLVMPAARGAIHTINEPARWIGDEGGLFDARGTAVLVGLDHTLKDPFNSSLADENYPTQVKVPQGGRLRDATQQYRWIVSAAARSMWEGAGLLETDTDGDPRSYLNAYMGNECELGLGSSAWANVVHFLTQHQKWIRSHFYQTRDTGLIRIAESLRQAGYCRGVSLPI